MSTTDQPSQRPVVVGRDVGRSFDGRSIYSGIDLDIHADEFVALLGRSGTGKSTLLRALAGLDDGYDGSVLVPAARSVVFQEPRLLPWRRVRANVELGLPRGGRRRALATGALAEVGLTERAGAWPVTLSGGEAQRVALARALVREPQLLLLDEPFGALDALTRLKMHGLLRELCRRHRPAVLLVTHDVDEAIALADRVLVLDGGRFVVDRRVALDHPRDRSEPAFGALRAELLEQLGVQIGERAA
ncbi:MAG TPA: ABC transporter ATP-binding protein [Ilumatobacter sp.]|nr:ABC transporter ATP-binding protein [Ilumatobacter sp.]